MPPRPVSKNNWPKYPSAHPEPDSPAIPVNPEMLQRPDLVGLPWLLSALLAGLLVALWVALHGLRRKARFAESRLAAVGFFLAGLGTGYAALWSLFQFLGTFLVLSTNWSLAFLAGLGAVALESLVALYQLEKSLTTARRGRLLLALRGTALVLLLLVLLQPVRSFLVDRPINREVAILVDDSQSMHLPDQGLTVSEQLDRAELFGIHGMEKRPTLHQTTRSLGGVHGRLAAEASALETAPDPAAQLKSRHDKLLDLLDESAAAIRETDAQLEQITKQTKLPGDAVKQLEDFRARLTGPASQAIDQASAQLQTATPGPFIQQLEALTQAFSESLATLPALLSQIDQAFYSQLNVEQRSAVDEASRRPRIDVARQLLAPSKAADAGDPEPGTAFIDQLNNDYNLRYYRFGRTIEELAKPENLDPQSEQSPPETFRSLTDLSGALDHILENTSPEALAGVLLLSDGRHNSGTLPEDHLRRMASQKSPLCAIPIGGSQGPVDASILSLKAPESIYLGDRIVVRAHVKIDGLRGKKIKAVLSSNGEPVDEQTVDVGDIALRREIRFVHLPEEKGIYDYQVTLEPDAAEKFPDNNRWDFKVAITDDRTNVLLVDSYPRWEFRYLRNLFYGRDKSVHLQYVLLNPDPIDGQPPLPPVHASASRKFGEAEATRLPENEDEWRLFDVIILGDIPPAALDSKTWAIIQKSVAERGALLITVAGQRYMPHAFRNPDFLDMAPTTWELSDTPDSGDPAAAYHLELTPAGRSHMATQLSASRAENARLWANMPELNWRSLSKGIKEGAEVLAYARPLSQEAAIAGRQNPGLDINPEQVENALKDLAMRKQLEQDNALIVTQQYAVGKVMQLNFDRTWRLRYGVGDTYHHRFWGQVLRWGTGENLRSGTEFVRLGTDHLSYTPSDPIKVVAKLLDAQRRPVTDATLHATLLDENKQPLHRQRLSYRTGSNGMYETTLAPQDHPGKYTLQLEGKAVDQALGDDPDAGLSKIETGLLVVSTRNPVELAELTADRDFLTHATQLSNGGLAKITEASALIEHFGVPKEILTERRNITLWDKWPLLAAFMGLFTTEWIFRRRAGLP